MAHGPGKYDQQLTDALKACGAQTGVLIVFDGDRGMSFCCQLSAEQMIKVPAVLRHMADDIDREVPRA